MNFESIGELRVLLETAKQGSLTAAAKVLGVTPAAASATLKRLEDRLKVRLFQRSTRSARPTAEGLTLIDYAQRALDLLREGEAQITDFQRSFRGSIRVTAPVDLSRHVLMPLFDEFLSAHPDVTLELRVSDKLLDVVRDEVDIAIRHGELSDSGLVARLLSPARRIACAAPAYLKVHGTPEHPSQLHRHQCIIFNLRGRRYTTWRFFDHDEPIEVQVDGRRTVDDADLAHLWALQGQGIVYKSELDLQRSIAQRKLVRLFKGLLGEKVPVHAVMPSNRFAPARVKALVDFLQKKLTDPYPNA